jgi:hypothetical protein
MRRYETSDLKNSINPLFKSLEIKVVNFYLV